MKKWWFFLTKRQKKEGIRNGGRCGRLIGKSFSGIRYIAQTEKGYDGID
jgi:hypothetical protein